MARLERQNALADALQLVGFQPGGNPRVPRLPGLPEPAASWAKATYKHLGGVLSAPILRPLGWDIPTAGGLIVELDEEQHFNRYRAAALDMNWAADLPWREDYLVYCAEFEHIALKGHSSGGRVLDEREISRSVRPSWAASQHRGCGVAAMETAGNV